MPKRTKPPQDGTKLGRRLAALCVASVLWWFSEFIHSSASFFYSLCRSPVATPDQSDIIIIQQVKLVSMVYFTPIYLQSFLLQPLLSGKDELAKAGNLSNGTWLFQFFVHNYIPNI